MRLCKLFRGGLVECRFEPPAPRFRPVGRCVKSWPQILENGSVKTTIEIPDDVFRQSKAAAALRGESLKDFVTASLRARLEMEGIAESAPSGWRSVYGQANPEEVAEVDEIVAQEFGSTEL